MRINISIDTELAALIDSCCKDYNYTRSQFLAMAARNELGRHPADPTVLTEQEKAHLRRQLDSFNPISDTEAKAMFTPTEEEIAVQESELPGEKGFFYPDPLLTGTPKIKKIRKATPSQRKLCPHFINISGYCTKCPNNIAR